MKLRNGNPSAEIVCVVLKTMLMFWKNEEQTVLFFLMKKRTFLKYFFKKVNEKFISAETFAG